MCHVCTHVCVSLSMCMTFCVGVSERGRERGRKRERHTHTQTKIVVKHPHSNFFHNIFISFINQAWELAADPQISIRKKKMSAPKNKTVCSN